MLPPGYFRYQASGSKASAQIILPLVQKLLPIKSVVDVGCGTGTWLAMAKKLGIKDFLGVDENQVAGTTFLVADLRQPIELKRRFDLAICLEVAEHLPKTSAKTLVESLTTLSRAVLFSAAIPLQGGPGHINEQWPSYWAKLFAKHDYGCLDILRPQIWENKRVEWWYRQNILLFVAGAAKVMPLSLVHPECFMESIAVCPPDIYKAKRYGWS